MVKLCPRCGLPYSYIERKRVRNREYFYAVHEIRGKGKRKRRKCYLGPREYLYVTSLHDDLILRGLIDSERIIKYLIEISNHIKKIYPYLNTNTRKEILSLLEKLLNDLRSL